MKLLTLGNPKVLKGLSRGWFPAVLHLAPNVVAGILDARGRVVTVCKRATAGCIPTCLNTAGRGGIFRTGETTNAIQRARIERTRTLFADPVAFARKLFREVELHAARAARLGLRPCFRPNGTSDIDWSSFGEGTFIDVFSTLSARGVVLYDYTKRPELFARYHEAGLPIHLTFSRAETRTNQRDARRVLADGGNVAVVFGTRRGHALPETFEGVPVIDGDETDLRFLDPCGVVVGLRAKGRARKDASGFVVPV